MCLIALKSAPTVYYLLSRQHITLMPMALMQYLFLITSDILPYMLDNMYRHFHNNLPQCLPFSLRGMSSGQAHVNPVLDVGLRRQRWLQPPLLSPQGLGRSEGVCECVCVCVCVHVCGVRLIDAIMNMHWRVNGRITCSCVCKQNRESDQRGSESKSKRERERENRVTEP